MMVKSFTETQHCQMMIPCVVCLSISVCRYVCLCVILVCLCVLLVAVQDLADVLGLHWSTSGQLQHILQRSCRHLLPQSTHYISVSYS